MKSRDKAIREAQEQTRRKGVKYVVRERFGEYLVLSYYEPGQEGKAVDFVHAALGPEVRP